ncbi:MAG: hypothetical protein ACOY3Z_09190 [Thermodesulfobacteriota bacterium]
MAFESLLGGDVTLDESTSALLDFFLNDTVAGTANVTRISGGAQVITADNGDGGVQMAVTPVSEATAVDLGSVHAELGAGMSMMIEGTNAPATAQEAAQVAMDVLDSAIPDPGADATLQLVYNVIVSAINTLTATVATRNEGMVSVEVITIDNASGAGQAVVDLSSSEGGHVAVLTATDAGSDVVVRGAEAIVIAGDMTVVSELGDNALISTDTGNQTVIGGAGAEDIIITGGRDVLTGGGGSDNFTFSGSSVAQGANINATINDLNLTEGDVVTFHVSDVGVQTLAQLVGLVSAISEGSEGVTIHFGENVSITLVGVDTEGLSLLNYSNVLLT